MGPGTIRIDMMSKMNSLDFPTAYARRGFEEVDGIRISMLGLVDLRKAKRGAGRDKDCNDLRHLPPVRKSKCKRS